MPKHRRLRKTCRGCARPRGEGELFSTTGLCSACSDERATENLRGLRSATGPYFEHYRQQMLAAFGGVPQQHRRDD